MLKELIKLQMIETWITLFNRITKTKIFIEEQLKKTECYTVHKGVLDTTPVSVYKLVLNETCFNSAKEMIMKEDKNSDRNMMTAHPRFVRYLGTCFNQKKLEAYVITDLVAGATIQVTIKGN